MSTTPPEPCRPILIGDEDPAYDELWVPVVSLVNPLRDELYSYNPRNGSAIVRDTWPELWARTLPKLSALKIYQAIEVRSWKRGEVIT